MKVNYLMYTVEHGLIFVSEKFGTCICVMRDHRHPCFVKSLKTGKWCVSSINASGRLTVTRWALNQRRDEYFKVSEFDPKEFKKLEPCYAGFGFGLYINKI